MRAPFRNPNKPRSCAGYSVVDLMIVVVIILIIVSYVWTTMTQAQMSHVRSNAAQQLATYLDAARSDSVRRRANDSALMAQVTFLNERFYSVSLDANGDGMLDAPTVVNLTEGLTMSGPFPRTIMFDSAGKPLDSSRNAMSATQIIFTNRGGKSAVTLSEVGKASFAQLGSRR